MYRVEMWFLFTALPLIAIYIYTKFHINYLLDKVPDGRTDGQISDYMLPPLGSIIILYNLEVFCYFNKAVLTFP